MPLNPVTLTTAILRLTDKTRSDFVGFPLVRTAGGDVDLVGTNQLVASNWADTAARFFVEAVVPPPNPVALAAGRSAFAQAMGAALNAPGGATAAAALSAGWAAFAVAFAGLITPPVATPPPAPLVIPVGPPTANPVPPAANIATAVFAWAKTGLYGVPPQPPSIPWS